MAGGGGKGGGGKESEEGVRGAMPVRRAGSGGCGGGRITWPLFLEGGHVVEQGREDRGRLGLVRGWLVRGCVRHGVGEGGFEWTARQGRWGPAR
eukprot:scaffold4022_cov122-Isochrysis_galbana.AAC.14